MLKKIIILTIILLLLCLTFGMLVIAPYHVYTLTLTEGVSTHFLVMKPSLSVFYDGQEFNYKKEFEPTFNDSSLYTDIHFSNFQMPMPTNHSLFSFIPIIKIENIGPRLGGMFIDGNSNTLFSFMIERFYRLETISDDQKLFKLPIFRNHINRKLEEEVWKDLFSKKLSLPSNVGKSFYESLLTLRKVTYNDLVYNLYILYNRNNFFPQNTLSISYDEKTKHGLIKLPSDDSKFLLERLYILEKGIIYSMTIKTKIANVPAEHFRERILKETIFKNSTSDSAIPVYAQYKNISYGKRIDQQGMTYLFSAWSHDLENKDYIRVIILFLERGKSNLKFLKPFYEYAYKKFGSNLSSESDLLLESTEEKLKRKAKEQIENEVKKAEEKSNVRIDGNFSSPEEKIKFNLQKAKDLKSNSDDSEKVLLQE